MEGQNHSPSSIGPMGRSLASVTAVMRHVLDAKPWLADPAVVPIGWRQEQYEEVQSRKLTIGLILDDNVVRVHPPIRRVLESLVEKLEAAGHEVVPWDCSEHEACMQLMVRPGPGSVKISNEILPGRTLHRRWWPGHSFGDRGRRRARNSARRGFRRSRQTHLGVRVLAAQQAEDCSAASL